MPQIIESKFICDVHTVKFNVFGDDRGRFIESFRKEWFPQRSWERVQSNCSKSRAGVLRGLHYHFYQVDFWMVAAGSIRAALYDLRLNSPTHGAAQTIDIGDDNPMGIFIPIGVAHGFVTLTDATLIYIVDNYYNGSDEFGIAWNDPDIAIPWNIANPMVSARDTENPRLSQIPLDRLPRRV